MGSRLHRQMVLACDCPVPSQPAGPGLARRAETYLLLPAAPKCTGRQVSAARAFGCDLHPSPFAALPTSVPGSGVPLAAVAEKEVCPFSGTSSALRYRQLPGLCWVGRDHP